MSSNYANIMLLGRTGVGKSSFINYLVGEEVSKVGVGMPVTQGFDVYTYDNINGLPLQIFDSKGLEVMDYKTIKGTIIDFVKVRCGDEDVHKWIHSIFYCVNAERRRLEPEEVSFIRSLRGEITQTVHIILTHCEDTVEGRKSSNEMCEYINSELTDNKIRIYCVNSTLSKTRRGTFECFGREIVLDQIFEMLWSDISYKIAAEYARELHCGLSQICDEIESAGDTICEQISVIDVIGNTIHDVEDFPLFDEQLRYIELKKDAIEQRLKLKYQEKVNSLVDFCNQYGRSMGLKIELYDPFDFACESFADIDFDEVFQKTKIGKLMDEMESIDEDNIWSVLKGIGKGIGALLSLKKMMKNCFNAMVWEFRRSIPAIKVMESSIYAVLLEGYQETGGQAEYGLECVSYPELANDDEPQTIEAAISNLKKSAAGLKESSDEVMDLFKDLF